MKRESSVDFVDNPSDLTSWWLAYYGSKILYQSEQHLREYASMDLYGSIRFSPGDREAIRKVQGTRSDLRAVMEYVDGTEGVGR